MNIYRIAGLTLGVFIIFGALLLAFPNASAQDTADDSSDLSKGLIAVGAGLAVGLSGIGAGLGEKEIGAAAIGAVAEDSSFFGTGIIFTVLPETIVIFGLLVSLMLLFVF